MENDMIVKKLLEEHKNRLKYLIQDANTSLNISVDKLNKACARVNEVKTELCTLSLELEQVEKELVKYA